MEAFFGVVEKLKVLKFWQNSGSKAYTEWDFILKSEKEQILNPGPKSKISAVDFYLFQGKISRIVEKSLTFHVQIATRFILWKIVRHQIIQEKNFEVCITS